MPKLNCKIIRTTLSVVFLLSFLNLQACVCKNYSFGEETNYSDMIFRGMLIEKRDSFSIGLIYYTFNISQVWKGESKKTIVLYSRIGGGPVCGATFEVDRDYIVYSKNGYTSSCSRNELYAEGEYLPMLSYKYNKQNDEKYGKDGSEILNFFESNYFNAAFNNQLYLLLNRNIKIDLENKKVAYLINDTLVSKKSFLSLIKIWSLYFILKSLKKKILKAAQDTQE